MPFSKGLQWFTRWLKKPSRNIQDEVAEVFYRCDKCFAEIVVRDQLQYINNCAQFQPFKSSCTKGVVLQSTISSLHYPLLYIQDGQSRYNCAECVASYDLCEGCYAMGAGEEHVQECGPLHTFTEEKMSDIRLSTKVKAERLEDTFRNMFQWADHWLSVMHIYTD